MSGFTITPNLGGAEIMGAENARTLSVSLAPKAVEITAIADRLDFDSASETLKELKAFSKQVSDQHATAKAPILELTRKIDGLKRELLVEVETQADRVGRLLGSYENAERERATEVQRAAENQARRIAADAERAALEARKKAPDPLAGIRASDKVKEEAQTKIVELQQTAINSVVPKTSGNVLRKSVEFEVTDMAALYKESPALVTLSPNAQAIRAICKANPEIQIAGLRHWIESKI